MEDGADGRNGAAVRSERARRCSPCASPRTTAPRLLEPMLGSLCRQCAALGESVEIVVSDNASTDGTREVVEAAATVYPIAYIRNDANVGSRNFLVSVEWASGEYAWVLGDDDLVLEGGLYTVTECPAHARRYRLLLRELLHGPDGRARRFISEEAAAGLPAVEDCVVRDPESRGLDSWENIFDLPTSNAVEVNTSILASVFRRSGVATAAPACCE